MLLETAYVKMNRRECEKTEQMPNENHISVVCTICVNECINNNKTSIPKKWNKNLINLPLNVKFKKNDPFNNFHLAREWMLKFLCHVCMYVYWKSLNALGSCIAKKSIYYYAQKWNCSTLWWYNFHNFKCWTFSQMHKTTGIWTFSLHLWQDEVSVFPSPLPIFQMNCNSMCDNSIFK